MQIVIELSEKDLDDIKNNDYIENTYYTMLNAITNGTQLPKGHGRLVDADEIDNNIYDLTRGMDLNYEQISEVVDTAPTIIKTDEVENEFS